MKSNIQGLRQIVALAIEANPDEYPDVVLGYVVYPREHTAQNRNVIV